MGVGLVAWGSPVQIGRALPRLFCLFACGGPPRRPHAQLACARGALSRANRVGSREVDAQAARARGQQEGKVGAVRGVEVLHGAA